MSDNTDQQLFKSHLVDTIYENMQDQVYRNVRNLMELIKDSPKDVEFLFKTFGLNSVDIPEKVTTYEDLGVDLYMEIINYVYDQLGWEFDDETWTYLPPGHILTSGDRANALLFLDLDPETVTDKSYRNLDKTVGRI